jgi:acyl carrier protein
MTVQRSMAEIEAALVEHLARKTGLAAAQIDRGKRFDHYGLDSADAVRLVGDLEDFVGRPLSATLPYKYPTVTALARRLAEGASE